MGARRPMLLAFELSLLINQSESNARIQQRFRCDPIRETRSVPEFMKSARKL